MQLGSAELQTLWDERAIRRVMERLVRGGDRIDEALVRDAFWDDAVYENPLFEGGLDAFVARSAGYARGRPGGATSLTLIGQMLIDIEGNVANTETYVIYHRPMLGTGGVVEPVKEPERGWRLDILGSRHVDRFERRDGQWKIAHRVTITDFSLITRGEMDFPDIAHWLRGKPAPDDYTYHRSSTWPTR